ncbi:MAG: Hsp70 family protein [Pseudomonadota bacterium]
MAAAVIEDALAVDFGTSNSAAAVLEDGVVRHLGIEGGAPTLPTAVFLPEGGGDLAIGQAAVDALIGGEDGRFMRALKSVLGTPLLHEKRLISGRRRTLADLVAGFLRILRERAEAEAGRSFGRVLSGRPVRFHSADAEADARAEADLRGCYAVAGFEEVAFLAEPEAAAVAAQSLGAPAGGGDLGLIVDIGGGTSDFSVFRAGAGARPEVLASHGIRLGGTDFDRLLSLAAVMPLLGLGGELRREMGEGRLPAPRAPYVDLATWAKIPFLYTAETRRMVAGMARAAVEPAPMRRFADVLSRELGHDLAFAVERGKIEANAGGAGGVDLGLLEPGLVAPLTPRTLAVGLGRERGALREAAATTLEAAGTSPDAVARVILVGGSSLMGFVSEEMGALCPRAEILRAKAFTAVVDGLALATAD